MSPEYDKSIAFLRQVHPNRKWVVTAIALDKKVIVTQTFDQSREADCLQWLNLHGADKNLYFAVNPPERDVQKKTERQDIAEMVYLHVDVDPRAGENLQEEQNRALALLKNPPGLPRPTCIVFSGGGYQAFWKLSEPVALNCDVEKAEDAKLYNLAIELALNADSCHNLDRIMRLPGTINRPDAAKAKKGRMPAMAESVEWHEDRIYPISQFSKAAAPAGNGAGNDINLSPAMARRVESVDQLPIPARAKVVIVQGDDPDSRFPSRSEALLYVCCELVRAQVPNETILGIITDPQYAISASVLDKRGSHKYALRQINRAQDFAQDDNAVARINREYFAVLEGKKITYYREEQDHSITPMNAEAFGFATAPIKATIETTDLKGNKKPIEVEAAKLWRTSSRRRFFARGFILDPTYGHAEDQYNLWKGFGVEPAPGSWSLMRRHIETVLAAGNSAHAEYIINWTAWTFQNPATPPRVALVFRGDEGTGKGFFGNALVDAFGHHGMRVQHIQQVAGRFNAHMRHCCMFFADEVSLVSDDQEGSLKGMITEPTLPIEAKGVDVVHAENHLHVVMASNRDFIIPAGPGARRFAMFDVAPTHKGDTEYFTDLWAERHQSGLAAMLHDLLKLPLGSWHPEAARPDTKALDDQKVRAMPSINRFWFNCLMSGALPCGRERSNGQVFMATEELANLINNKMRLCDREQVTTTALGLLFKQFGFAKIDKGRPRGWSILPLALCRKKWDEQMRMTTDWDAAPEWQVEVGSPLSAPERVAEPAPF